MSSDAFFSWLASTTQIAYGSLLLLILGGVFLGAGVAVALGALNKGVASAK